MRVCRHARTGNKKVLRTLDTKTCKRLHKPQGIKTIETEIKNTQKGITRK